MVLSLVLSTSAFVWSCSVFRRTAHGADHVLEETEDFDDSLFTDFPDYYDTLSLMEEIRYLDSCEQVFLMERDSLLLLDSVFSVDGSEKTRTLNDSSFLSQTLADSIIDYAKRFMRVPYIPGGNGPDKLDRKSTRLNSSH